MLHEFLDKNRTELIARCRAKVALRPSPRPSSTEMAHGIPLFLDQLIGMLRAEEAPGTDKTTVRAAQGALAVRSRSLEASAARHGNELLQRGFTLEQVVHDYGDLCQAITELAVEQDQPVGAKEFRTLNGCLDDAIAGAVTEFGLQRDSQIADSGDRAMSERLGYIAHELRNCLNTAVLAYEAIRGGHVGLKGATAEVLERSFVCLRDLIDRPFVDARLAAGSPPLLVSVEVGPFITELRLTTTADAKRAGCDLTVTANTPGLVVKADKQMLYSALSNLLHNAFAFTRPRGEVILTARGAGDRVLFEIEDECAGLSSAVLETLSRPSSAQAAIHDSPGRGISIARRALEAMGGTLTARALPSGGCIFTMDLPRDSTGQAIAA